MNTTVSIIIPAKNEERRLPRCFSAISKLGCSDCDIEVIVMDNGSEDNTVGVAREHGANVYVRKSDNISGLRNYGAKASQGEVLVFIDADVEVKPDFLKNALKHFTDCRVGIVTGLILIPDNTTWVEKTWYLNRTCQNIVREVDWSSSMNMIIRRETFFSVGGFPEDMITYEDMVLCQKVKKNGNIICFDPQVQVIHFGEAKSLRSLFKKERWRGTSSMTFIKKYPKDYKRLISFLQIPYFLTSFAGSILLLAFFYYYTGLFAFLCTILLPFLRSINISRKAKTLKYFHKIFIVWFVYYCARSVSILDVVRNSIFKSS